MRKALNENPMIQIGVLVVVGIAFVVLLFTTVLKGKGAETDTAATGTDPAAVAAAPPVAQTPADPGTGATPTPPPDPAAGEASAVPPVAGSATVPPATPSDPGAANGLLPSKGLPADVLVAYAKNQAIALLVVDPKAPGAAKIRNYTQRLAGRDDVEVFVVKEKDVADYSRITSGVGISQTPALIIIRPRKMTSSVPIASVSYGFRGPKSVSQALKDALYKGGQVTSYP